MRRLSARAISTTARAVTGTASRTFVIRAEAKRRFVGSTYPASFMKLCSTAGATEALTEVVRADLQRLRAHSVVDVHDLCDRSEVSARADDDLNLGAAGVPPRWRTGLARGGAPERPCV